MNLNFKKLGSGKPLIILHGLFGSLDNWQTLGKRFAEDYTVYLVDQRNHGKSPHFDEMGYEEMAADLFEFAQSQKLEDINLIGHSMGGKTAMLFAHLHPDLLEKLIVVDIAPKRYNPHHDLIFKALLSTDFSSMTTRSKVEEHIRKHLSEEGVIQFLMKNVHWIEKGVLGWKFNLPILHASMPKILGDFEIEPNYIPTLFIDGGLSEYIQEEDEELIQTLFPYSTTETIEDSGHWVHAESPETFYRLSRSFIG